MLTFTNLPWSNTFLPQETFFSKKHSQQYQLLLVPFLRQYPQVLRHDVRYAQAYSRLARRLRVSRLLRLQLCNFDVGYVRECISTLSKRKAVVCSWHIVLPFSSVCVLGNSLCPTFHKYILSVLRLSIEAISGSGVRICYTPGFIDKIDVEWEKSFYHSVQFA